MLVNNKETSEGDKAYYIDRENRIYEATIKSLTEQDGNAFADLDVDINGTSTPVENVPHNTSPEKHSWNHSII
ncbi:MAG: hypothetical protein AUF65_00470 [Chloroflexi bacterium 13_1_20CM_50_12]|nr:MAG: hypothetical protein AUF65_00470 [Chloroflexi bacterium 13_1_20CM_50_12]